MSRPLLSLWPYWWRGLIVFICVLAWPWLVLFVIQPPWLLVSLCVLFGIEATLVVRRFRRFWRFLWHFCLRVRRFKTQSRARITIHYPPHLESQWNMQALLQRCETERDELTDWFGFKLRRRLVVFLLDDRTSMREVLGRASGGFAMLLGNAIVLAADAVLEEVIRHELVHLFAARWSTHARPLLNEGIAVWLQRTYDGIPIDTKALRFIGNPGPSLSPLLSPKFFFADANAYSCYVLAGSFTGFLIRRYGVKAYRKFFRKTNASNLQDYFKKVFGVTFGKAEWQWHTELQTMAVLKRRLRSLC